MKIDDILVQSIKEIVKEKYEIEDDSLIMVEIPKDNTNGDYSSNIAMRLTKLLKRKPQDIATEIKEELENRVKEIDKVEIAGPGFINFWMKKDALANVINTIIDLKEEYGKSYKTSDLKYLQEYVSANPTGPLHCGHARGAAWGDSVSRIMKAAGYDITREYYINDAGAQIHNLGLSVFARYKELQNLPFELPDDGYHGEDVKEIAKEIYDKYQDKFLNMDEDKAVEELSDIAKKIELERIKEVLKEFGVEFDSWISETWLRQEGMVDAAVNELTNRNLTYIQEAALWFKTSEFGDEKDRVLKKSDGLYTYMAPDIANHKYKFDRGYDVLIDIWGADHHGYIARVKAALKALGYDENNLIVDLCQMVRLMEDGTEVKMSKRTGNALTIKELIDDIGVDAARYFFLSKALDTHLDFDLNLARSKTNDNPVYYIQYAYARICTILNNQGSVDKLDSYNLDNEKEVDLLKHLNSFPDVVLDAGTNRAPNKICNYVYKLANYFHSFYGSCKIVDEENELKTKERLALIEATRIVIKNALDLLGVSSPERM